MENKFPKNVRQIGNVSDTPKKRGMDRIVERFSYLVDTKR